MTLIEFFKQNLPSSKKEIYHFFNEVDKKIKNLNPIDLIAYKQEFIDFYNYFSYDYIPNHQEFLNIFEKVENLPDTLLLGQHYVEVDKMFTSDKNYFSLNDESRMLADILVNYIITQDSNVLLYYIKDTEDPDESEITFDTYYSEDLEEFMNQKIIRGDIADLMFDDGILIMKCYKDDFCGKCYNYGFILSEEGIGIIDEKSLKSILKDIPNDNKEENIYKIAEFY